MSLTHLESCRNIAGVLPKVYKIYENRIPPRMQYSATGFSIARIQKFFAAFEELEPSARLFKRFWRFRQLMKKIMMFLIMGATVALLALPVTAKSVVVVTAVQDACAQEARDVLYKTFVDNRQADQKKAYDAAKKYLACPVATPTEAQTKIIEYLTKWVGLFEKGDRKNRFTDELYNKRNYVEAFKVGGEILKDEPDNTKVMVDLGANGYLVGPLNNPQ